jgi:hypothetical protein
MKNLATTKDAAEAVTVTIEPLNRLGLYWQAASGPLSWDCVFMLPPWLGTWALFSGRAADVQLRVVRLHEALLGIAPLSVSGDSARLVSDEDLIDYSDLIISPLLEKEFFLALFGHLRQHGIRRIEMARVRADSKAVSYLSEHSAALGCRFLREPVDVLYEMDLPDSWDKYIARLSGKERHETRRKIWRLESAGDVRLRVIEERPEVAASMETFIELFRSGVAEKAKFMTAAVESFFRSLAAGMAGAGLLRLFFLDLRGIPVAAAMCFDYESVVYLYNNGYDRRFSRLSVGLLSKVLSIKDSIARGRRKYNFLRGAETYKRRLGGGPVELLRCEVVLR